MNGKSMKRMLLVTIVLAVMVLSGFSVLSGSAAAAPASTRAEGDLVVAFQQDIPNLNIFDPATNTVWKFDALGWSFESLFAYTPDLIPYPVIAESYTVDTPDGLNVTVHLRQDVHFQDGTPLTAKDVVFSYQTLYFDSLYTYSLQCLYWSDPIWPRWDNASLHSHIGVVAVDDYTVQFHLSHPFPLFYHLTLGTTIIPEHIWVNHLTDAGTGDSDDMTLDMTWTDDPAALIGTGPFEFVEWKTGNYVKIKVYSDYWGKGMYTTWQGKQWPWYPEYVKTVTFKIYNTLDTAVLALKKGEVQFIDWSVPPGYYNQLKTDPNIGSTIVDDQGFFYIAFNMRKEPMNDLAFRTAVAHSIDKDYIVTRLMQGYGTKGTVPISITSGAYVNTSAIPPDFDLNAATQVLDDAGYVDSNGDGWREAPDGSPIKETILTPPKDYDPIRAEAGIMMQANLQKIGLNIESSPTDFDTIVSKAFVQVQFDMYVLGWGVGSFPEAYLEDFFASWNAAPVGYNTPGYSNPKVDDLFKKIRVEMDTQKRIQMVKDVEGILVHDLPYDTLYYRKNIMCYRKDMWDGWVSAFGTIWNGFSLATIHPGTGNQPVTPIGPGESTEVSGAGLNGVVPHMYVPDVAYAGQNLNGLFYVTDANGLPIPGVNVTIWASAGNGVYANGTTGDSGGFSFSIPLAFQEYHAPVKVLYTFSVNMNGQYYNFTGSKLITVYLPKNVVRVKMSMDGSVLTPGASTIVRATVTDLYMNPIPNVNVTILTQETLGTIEPYNYTDENGVATFHYTAPTNVQNINAVDVVRGTVNIPNTILTNLQTGTLFIPIQSQGSSWYKVTIESVSSWGITAGNSTDITVKVVDINGNGVADHDVYVAAYYSNATDPNWYGQKFNPAWGVEWDATEKTTDANGEATFTLTATENANIPVVIQAYTMDTYTASDYVTVYVGNDTGMDAYIGAWTGLYAVDISLDKITTTYGQQVQVTATFYNASDGSPLNDTFVFMAVFGTDYGFGADWANNAGTYVWWAGQSVIWGFTDANGQFSYTLNTSALRADQPIYVDAWLDAYGYGFDAIWTGLGFDFPYLFGAKDAFILQRAPIMGITEESFNEFFLNDTITTGIMTVKVEDINGPLADVTLMVDWSAGSYSNYTMATTNADGIAQFNITIKPQIADTPVVVSILLMKDDHAMNLNYEYYIPFLSGTSELSKVRVFSDVKIGNDVDMIAANGTGQIAVTLVGDLQGRPIVNREVTLTVTAGSVDQATVTTDENGVATFTYTAPNNMLPSHYVFAVTSWDGAVYYFGVEVGGNYANTSAIANEINDLNQQIADTTQQLNNLQNQYNTLQQNYTDLQKAYDTLQDEKSKAVTMEYVFLGLFILMLIVAIAMYMMGKKKGGAVPEEETAEETEEVSEEEEELGEEEEEYSEEESAEEETSEEETSEEENTEE